MPKSKKSQSVPVPVINSEYEYLTTTDVSALIKRRPATLKIERHRRVHGLPGEKGIPFFKNGSSVLYLRSDVETYMASKKVR